MTQPMTISAMGVPWYAREDYPKIWRIMEDAHLLPRTFDDWLQKAEQALKHAVSKGIVPVKANLNSQAFVAWCRERGLHVNADARMKFANSVAYTTYVDGRA